MINDFTLELEYSNAYSELLEIFKYLDKSDYDKIPKDKINLIQTKANKNYLFTYDTTKRLEEQKISKTTREILAVFFCEYWATDEQKNKIKKYDKNYHQKQELLAKEKYNPNNIFNQNVISHKDTENINNEMALVKINEKDNLIIKFFKFIKSKFFNK